MWPGESFKRHKLSERKFCVVELLVTLVNEPGCCTVTQTGRESRQLGRAGLKAENSKSILTKEINPVVSLLYTLCLGAHAHQPLQCDFHLSRFWRSVVKTGVKTRQLPWRYLQSAKENKEHVLCRGENSQICEARTGSI